mgnify:CR=1 FL=1
MNYQQIPLDQIPEVHASNFDSLQIIVIQDGYKLDSETGEILGLAEPFQVHDVKSAEWVLEKMQEAEAQARAYETQAADIMTNLAKLTKFHRSKAEWLRACYGSQLEEVARENLPKGKRTWSSLFGSVAFRTTAPRLDIVDEADAIAWAKAYYPEAVKVKESLLKSNIPTDETYPPNSGIVYVPEGESVTIKVGA